MRDPQRIPIVLKEVERIWRLHPDMRLGQLISNIAFWADQSVWDIEEDDLTAEIDRHVKQYLERREAESIPSEMRKTDSDATSPYGSACE